MTPKTSGSGAVAGAGAGGGLCSPSGNNSANIKQNDISVQKKIDLNSDHGFSKEEIAQLLEKGTHVLDNADKRLKGKIEDGLPLIAVNDIDKNWGDIPGFDRSPRVKDLNEHLYEFFGDLKDKPVEEWFSDISSKKEGHAMSRLINLMARQHGLGYSDGDFLQELKEIFQFEDLAVESLTKVIFGDVTFIHTYQDLIKEFLKYLVRTEKTTVLLGNLTGEKNLSFVASHRWDENYSSTAQAKLLDLKESRFNNMPVAVLRLSGYQDGLKPEDFDKDRERSWFELNDDLDLGRKRLLDKLRKVARRKKDGATLHYFWVREPHGESGYPHIHLVVFGEMAHWLRKKRNQDYIINLWSNKWDIGNEHGLHFSCDIPQRNGEGTLENVANYLLKYLSKSFGSIDSEHEDKEIMDMSYEELLYNAGLWASGSRSWSASKEVSSVMANNEDTESKGVFVSGGGTYNKAPEDVTLEDVVNSCKEPTDIINVPNGTSIHDTFELRQKLRPKIKERHGDTDDSTKDWDNLYD